MCVADIDAGRRFATTAKVAGGLHLLQTLSALTAVGAWWYMSRAYMSVSYLTYLSIYIHVYMTLHIDIYQPIYPLRTIQSHSPPLPSLFHRS